MGTRNRAVGVSSSDFFVDDFPYVSYDEFHLMDYVDFHKMFQTEWFKWLQGHYKDDIKSVFWHSDAFFGENNRYRDGADVIEMDLDGTKASMLDDGERVTATLIHELVHRTDIFLSPKLFNFGGRNQPMLKDIPEEALSDDYLFTFQGCGDYLYSRCEVNAHQAELKFYLSRYPEKEATKRMFETRSRSWTNDKDDHARVFSYYLKFLLERIKAGKWEQEPVQ